MQQFGFKAKNQIRAFFNIMNFNLGQFVQKDLFGLWMGIRERVYGDQTLEGTE